MHEHHHKTSSSSVLEYIKFASVVLAILAISVIAFNNTDSSGWMEWMRLFMGVFLVVFAAFKFAGYKMFTMMFAGYDLVAKRYKAYAHIYPFIELALGIMFLAGAFELFSSAALFVVMSVASTGVFQEIYHRRSGIYCACLGNIIKLPLSTVSLVENVTMAVMAIFMVFALL